MDRTAGLGRSALARTRLQRALPMCLAASLLYAALACLAPSSISLAQDGEVLEDVSGDTSTGGAEKKERTVLDTVIDGGVVGLFIVLLSVVSVGFIVEHFMTIRKTTLMPDVVAADFQIWVVDIDREVLILGDRLGR